MKRIICLMFVAVLPLSAAFDFSYDVVSSDADSVLFKNSCEYNEDCLKGAREYCGEDEYHSYECMRGRLCDVVCSPLKTFAVGKKHHASISVLPLEKRAGEGIHISSSDVNGPLSIEFWLYKKGDGKTSGIWLGDENLLLDYRFEKADGEVVLKGRTNRWGSSNFSVQEPGRYLLRALSKYTIFEVSGDRPSCGDEICAGEEDVFNCPADCRLEEVSWENETKKENVSGTIKKKETAKEHSEDHILLLWAISTVIIVVVVVLLYFIKDLISRKGGLDRGGDGRVTISSPRDLVPASVDMSGIIKSVKDFKDKKRQREEKESKEKVEKHLRELRGIKKV